MGKTQDMDMSVRSLIDQTLIVLGVICIVTPVALVDERWTTLTIVLSGVLMVGLGVWRLGHRILPDRRVYVELRAEVEGFIRLVRRLNSRALASDRPGVERLRGEMKDAVDRMVAVAGRRGPLE
jgi:hypothetical protein